MDAGSLLTGSTIFSDLSNSTLDTTITSSVGSDPSINNAALSTAMTTATPLTPTLSLAAAPGLPPDASGVSVSKYMVRVGLAHGGHLLAKYQVTMISPFD